MKSSPKQRGLFDSTCLSYPQGRRNYIAALFPFPKLRPGSSILIKETSIGLDYHDLNFWFTGWFPVPHCLGQPYLLNHSMYSRLLCAVPLLDDEPMSYSLVKAQHCTLKTRNILDSWVPVAEPARERAKCSFIQLPLILIGFWCMALGR